MMLLEHDQEKLLDEASAVVKEQGRYMKRAIESDNLRDALKHASNMICELRTSLLSPKNYYELYMLVFHELQHLASFFSEGGRHCRRLSELYESVQHAGNILPRLYLLITVGSSYIKAREARACDVLRDMTELCKGVQHPMRGLFLRFYLTQMCKDKLPDAGSLYEREGGGTLEDAFWFLLTNFTEAARLWVRLQQQSSGTLREKQQRERERRDLRVLVGTSLVRIAQLEGLSITYYKQVVLPRLLERVIDCRDGMAQQYLFDCIVQVFSDDCHLHTLDELLEAAMHVQPTVDLKSIIVNLLNRLAAFAQTAPCNLPPEVDVYTLFHRYIEELQNRFLNSIFVEEQGGSSSLLSGGSKMNGNNSALGPSQRIEGSNISNWREEAAGSSGAAAGGSAAGAAAAMAAGGAARLTLTALLELQLAFLSFSLSLFADRIDYVDGILASTSQLLSRCGCSRSNNSSSRAHAAEGAAGGSWNSLLCTESLTAANNKRAALTAAGVDALVEIISSPLKIISLPVLEVEHFSVLMSYLDEETRKQVAASMVEAVLAAGVPLEQPASLSRFLDFISPLLQDSSSGPFDNSKRHCSSRAESERDDVGGLDNGNNGLYKREDEDALSTSSSSHHTVWGSAAVPPPPSAADSAAAAEAAGAAFVREQESVAKLIHLLRNVDTDIHFTLLCLARQKVLEGGPKRLKYLGGPLVIEALQLVPRICMRYEQHHQQQQQLEQQQQQLCDEKGPADSKITLPVVSGKKVFQFVHGICMQLVQCDPQTALRLFLMAAECADSANMRSSSSRGAQSGYEAIVYEYLTQALVCYEEEILDSKSQYQLLYHFVGSMAGHVHTLDKENYETLSAKVAQHAAKLLKKPDQCRAILACSHLFWNNEVYRDSRRVLECLQKSLKIADVAVQSSTAHVSLFTDILDEYIYYYQQGNTQVTLDFIQNLLALCGEHVKFAIHETGEEDEAVVNFRNTVRFLKAKREAGDDIKWRGLRSLDDYDVYA